MKGKIALTPPSIKWSFLLPMLVQKLSFAAIRDVLNIFICLVALPTEHSDSISFGIFFQSTMTSLNYRSKQLDLKKFLICYKIN